MTARPLRTDPQGLLPAGPLAWYGHTRAQFLGGNQVRLLRGGKELFPAMCQAIEAARHEVWFATYIFHDDEAANCVAASLGAAARRGVRVRVILDGFGSLATLPRLLPQLREAGVRVVVFRPIKGWWSWLRPGQLRRLHQKLCVVDGAIGFVGGINVIDDLLDLRHGWGEAPRLDYAVEVKGPTVVPIEQTARAMWTRATLGRDWREELAGLARSPHRVARARRLMRRLQATRWARHTEAVADTRPMRAAFVVRDNLRQRRTIERAYIEAIRRARERVDLVSPYFYPGRAFRRALRLAAQRGVRVRLLLQGKLDYRIAGLAARVLYDELLAHGVRVYEYMPAFLHAKVAVVDDSWATVGSSNIDPLSLLLNLEANVIVRDPGFVAELASELDSAFAVSHEVTRPELGVPNWWSRVRRAFVAWAAHIYLRVAGATGRY
ncbi:cardiolipin synthase ClsB [Aquabacterium sp. A7-Y]|uniref:cardiolipin synthase ClsB n=1 Tax=Aquabacterium sp. A7-Y TaxID=1349605 RepID=UPI00223DBAD9|nr:cardiolipin synthase ClsB [Aquabacterium sp. A7-Y]MCW7541537.1 cardiolipin synthase ClsB [Aquabacterium sp. A7-Y]